MFSKNPKPVIVMYRLKGWETETWIAATPDREP